MDASICRTVGIQEGLAAVQGAAQPIATADDGDLDSPPRHNGGGNRPATRERGNGRMALTVLKPTLETLGEEVEADGEAAEEAARDRMRRGESLTPGGEAGKGKTRDPVPLKVGERAEALMLHITIGSGHCVRLTMLS